MPEFKSASSLEVLLLWVWGTACLQDRSYMGVSKKPHHLQLGRVLSGRRVHCSLICESPWL